MLSGRITDWNPDRGFGFVESDGQRLFLHYRDFTKRYKVPEVGDAVTFELGKDKQGRPCAQRAAHVNEGGRISSENILFVLLLNAAPFIALIRLSRRIPGGYLATYWIGISLITYFAYVLDKRAARTKGWREPEALLHVLELIGGWPGAFFAQRHIRHKCSKVSYQIVFWLIVAAYQFVAFDYLHGWVATRSVMESLWRLLHQG